MFFRSSLFRLLVLAISLGLCVSAARTIVGLWQRRDLITNRQKDLSRIASENATLRRQLEETRTEQYVERVARDKLGLVRDGETIILLPDAETKGREDDSLVPTESNWRQWLRLVI